MRFNQENICDDVTFAAGLNIIVERLDKRFRVSIAVNRTHVRDSEFDVMLISRAR